MCCNSAHRRHGYSLMEVIVALAILGTLLAGVGQLGVLSLNLRNRSQAEQESAIVASNLMERITALEFEELTSLRIDQLAHSAANDRLSLAATVHDDEVADESLMDGTPLRSRRVVVTATHRRQPGISAQFIGWRHARKGSSP